MIDFIATDMPDLLRQLDGREVNGKVLQTASAAVVDIPMSAHEKDFSDALARPEVMMILMLAAIYGIIGEMSNPGAILPGVVGAIALILALYMAAVLPVNVAGLALIALAIALFIIDVFAPTHGVLTAGGIISFFLGALMLFNRAEPAVPALAGLHHSGHRDDGAVLPVRGGGGLAGAVAAGAGRDGNDAGQGNPGAGARSTPPAARCSSRANTGTRSATRRSRRASRWKSSGSRA